MSKKRVKLSKIVNAVRLGGDGRVGEGVKTVTGIMREAFKEDEFLMCSICFKTNGNMTISSKCGHSICESCKDDIFTPKGGETPPILRKCPHCRCEIVESDMYGHKVFRRWYELFTETWMGYKYRIRNVEMKCKCMNCEYISEEMYVLNGSDIHLCKECYMKGVTGGWRIEEYYSKDILLSDLMKTIIKAYVEVKGKKEKEVEKEGGSSFESIFNPFGVRRQKRKRETVLEEKKAEELGGLLNKTGYINELIDYVKGDFFFDKRDKFINMFSTIKEKLELDIREKLSKDYK